MQVDFSSFIQELSSQNPSATAAKAALNSLFPTAHAASSAAAAAAPAATQAFTPSQQFKREDYDYRGYTSADEDTLLGAENCCAFPKLALAVYKHLGGDITDIYRAMNDAERAGHQGKSTMSYNDFARFLKK